MRDISELDEFAQKAFKRITSKQPQELNLAEVAFVKARRDYLGGDLEKKFDAILNPPKKEVKKTTKTSKK